MSSKLFSLSVTVDAADSEFKLVLLRVASPSWVTRSYPVCHAYVGKRTVQVSFGCERRERGVCYFATFNLEVSKTSEEGDLLVQSKTSLRTGFEGRTLART